MNVSVALALKYLWVALVALGNADGERTGAEISNEFYRADGVQRRDATRREARKDEGSGCPHSA